MFSSLSKVTLAKAVLTHNSPVYVQFYLTARCNLTCQQCNIIYANSDVRECSLDSIKRIADNFTKLGVAMVLLTGGEPFVRTDLAEIIRAFEERGIHVRMQTNGHATEERIHECIEAGGRDISISLDSLVPDVQDSVNGGFKRSWNAALQAMAHFTKYLPREESFAALGCVLQRTNLDHVRDVIEFAKVTDWFVSLVPIHVTELSKPMNFRSFDTSLRFRTDEYERVDKLVEEVRSLRSQGYPLYDSDQYLDDIKRFIRGEPTTWRSKNSGVCDSPGLYFAILPNGHFAPCCDHRVEGSPAAFDPEFPIIFKSREFRQKVYGVTSQCSGCMYGSYPEMTISMRFIKAMLERFKLFIAAPPEKRNWPLTYEELCKRAAVIREATSSAVKIENKTQDAAS